MAFFVSATMRLKLTATQSHHKDMVTALCWTPTNELFTCSDDGSISKWDLDGEHQGKVCDLDTYVTDMSWFPSVGKQASDIFAVSCTDGTFRLMSKTGREEKKVEAAVGAVISLRWNYDGSALVTAGEDGSVKVWSRTGMLRSAITQAGKREREREREGGGEMCGRAGGREGGREGGATRLWLVRQEQKGRYIDRHMD